MDFKKFLPWLSELLEALVLSAMQTSFYRWLMLWLLPRLRFSNEPSDIYGWKYQALYDAFQPGDILLTIDRHHVASLAVERVTGGTVSHAALGVAKGENWEVSEMVQQGYTQSTFYDICRHADRVIVGTCDDFDPEYIQQMIAECRKNVGAAYNTRFQFIFDVKILYCSELVYLSDFEQRLNVVLEEKLGKLYISPEGILRADNFRIKLDSDKMVPPQGLNVPKPR